MLDKGSYNLWSGYSYGKQYGSAKDYANTNGVLKDWYELERLDIILLQQLRQVLTALDPEQEVWKGLRKVGQRI